LSKIGQPWRKLPLPLYAFFKYVLVKSCAGLRFVTLALFLHDRGHMLWSYEQRRWSRSKFMGNVVIRRPYNVNSMNH